MSGALAALAAVGGFALAAFAKAAGLAFLGEPRTPAAANAAPAGRLALAPLLFLAGCILAAAAFAPMLLSLAGQAALAFPGLDPAPARAALAQAADILQSAGLVCLGIVALTLAVLFLRSRLLTAHDHHRARRGENTKADADNRQDDENRDQTTGHRKRRRQPQAARRNHAPYPGQDMRRKPVGQPTAKRRDQTLDDRLDHKRRSGFARTHAPSVLQIKA